MSAAFRISLAGAMKLSIHALVFIKSELLVRERNGNRRGELSPATTEDTDVGNRELSADFRSKNRRQRGFLLTLDGWSCRIKSTTKMTLQISVHHYLAARDEVIVHDKYATDKCPWCYVL